MFKTAPFNLLEPAPWLLGGPMASRPVDTVHRENAALSALDVPDARDHLVQVAKAIIGENDIHTESKPSVPSLSSPSSTDDSPPLSPVFGPPINFSEVAPGIYRSSFPRPCNFEHLAQLGLKTVMTLVPNEYPIANVEFIKAHGTKHVQIPILAHKKPYDSIPLHSMYAALEVLCDRSNYPILVHCNKGKHRTGCVIGCFRKINGWGMDAIIDEYRHFAGPKARELDEKYLDLFDNCSMEAKLNDAVFALAEKQRSLITPPPSDKGSWKEAAEVRESPDSMKGKQDSAQSLARAISAGSQRPPPSI